MTTPAGGTTTSCHRLRESRMTRRPATSSSTHVRKTHLFTMPVYYRLLKLIILPRQARDKNSKKQVRFSQQPAVAALSGTAVRHLTSNASVSAAPPCSLALGLARGMCASRNVVVFFANAILCYAKKAHLPRQARDTHGLGKVEKRLFLQGCLPRTGLLKCGHRPRLWQVHRCTHADGQVQRGARAVLFGAEGGG
jgi:hypothetical protein